MIDMDYGDDPVVEVLQLRAEKAAIERMVVLQQTQIEEMRAAMQLTRGYIASTRGPQSILDALTNALRED